MNVTIILVGTTHPGNIGATARAMKNMGLNELILVNPKSFPDPEASARASGAEEILRNTTIFDNLSDAIKDFTYVVGASSRSRTIDWPSFDVRACAIRFVQEGCNGKAAAVFGPEHSGLTNSDLDHCHALLTIPSDPSFSSLNIAMAVQILTYELRMSFYDGLHDEHKSGTPLASVEELEHFYSHLEDVLTRSNFLDPDNPRYLMRRLRRFFVRATPDKNEVNIFRGILTSLDQKKV